MFIMLDLWMIIQLTIHSLPHGMKLCFSHAVDHDGLHTGLKIVVTTLSLITNVSVIKLCTYTHIIYIYIVYT